MSSEEKVEGLKMACNKAIAKGITTVHALEGGMLFGDTEIYQVQQFASRAPLRITPYFQTLDVEKAIAAGVRRIGGCIPLDGSIGSRTAALAEPYSDQPETSGSIYHSDEAVKKFMTDAYSAGMQISVHAIGERAIDQALDSFEHAARHFPGYSCPHRIEHFIMATDEHINRAVSLGLVISIQPVDHLIWGRPDRLLGMRLGDRLPRINRYKTWSARGLVLAGSSDSDITEFDPLKGIYSAMYHYFSEECLDFSDALRLYTSNAALAGLELPEKGTVEVGKLADLVVLSGPVKDGRDFGSLEVALTLVGGRVVYGELGRL
jgi:predicted amidohydrolase YtcJ